MNIRLKINPKALREILQNIPPTPIDNEFKTDPTKLRAMFQLRIQFHVVLCPSRSNINTDHEFKSWFYFACVW